MSKYIAGELVCALVNPSQHLIIRRYLHRIYYCRVADDINHRELAFFERELTPVVSYSLLPKDEQNPETSEFLFWN